MRKVLVVLLIVVCGAALFAQDFYIGSKVVMIGREPYEYEFYLIENPREEALKAVAQARREYPGSELSYNITENNRLLHRNVKNAMEEMSSNYCTTMLVREEGPSFWDYLMQDEYLRGGERITRRELPPTKKYMDIIINFIEVKGTYKLITISMRIQ